MYRYSDFFIICIVYKVYEVNIKWEIVDSDFWVKYI